MRNLQKDVVLHFKAFRSGLIITIVKFSFKTEILQNKLHHKNLRNMKTKSLTLSIIIVFFLKFPHYRAGNTN